MNYQQKFDQTITDALETNGAFFAFGDKQFNEQKVDGVKYANLGAGLICPVDNAKAFMTTFDKAVKQRVSDDLAENGIENIIMRELASHECYYTGDISDCVDKLEDYPVTFDQIQAVYRRELPKQDV